MRQIIYYVATSLDGFIAGPDGDISGFAGEGNGVDRYLQDIQKYSTVIMGRNTYEFGYRFGLKPGQPAYPHMKHYIFSEKLYFENPHPQVNVVKLSREQVNQIKAEADTDIYLCGGGQLAGWLLQNSLIDQIILKMNPFIQGQGTRLFGEATVNQQLLLQESVLYDNGLQIMKYEVR